MQLWVAAESKKTETFPWLLQFINTFDLKILVKVFRLLTISISFCFCICFEWASTFYFPCWECCEFLHFCKTKINWTFYLYWRGDSLMDLLSQEFRILIEKKKVSLQVQQHLFFFSFKINSITPPPPPLFHSFSILNPTPLKIG